MIKGYHLWKFKFYRPCVRDRYPNCSKLAINWKNNNGVIIFRDDVIVKFFWRCCVFLLSLVNGPNFKSLSLLVLELWQFSFLRDWPEIWKLETPSLEFCPISRDWSELGISNLVRMSLIKCYWMLQNTSVTASTVSKLLRGGGNIILPQIRVK